MNRQDKEQLVKRLEEELLDALKTRQFEISQEELKQRSLVSILREKLGRP
jgi:hypothetical protein